MTNRGFVVWTSGPTLIAALVAAGCSGASSAGSGPARGTGGSGGAGDSSVASDDAGVGAVPPGTNGDATTPVGADDASGPASSTDSGAAGLADSAVASDLPGWKLTWSDEFNGPDGSAVDPTKWKHDVGGTGWGNNELEYYTDGMQNAVVQGGNLVVTATTEDASQYKCSYGTCKYTSARLLTQGLFSQQYGRFEARAQMPTGKGLWPAIWALGDNISTVSWPACGEIDFMETIGTDIQTNHGSLHMPSNYGPSGTYKLPNGASYADDFHVFAFEWEPGTIRFYVDDMLYETQTSKVPSGDTWEFEHPFFLLINVAVGGQWPGSPDSTTTFPQTLKVDYVRVYQKDGTEP
ncbi:MAG TPA: glycoside hydrolase family 16 protein [Polyangiaceae bacterium]|nr:glycoside hydrolase family 16 protein [Polyangiaceae bacterium]